MDNTCRITVLGTIAFLLLTANSPGWASTANEPPVAEAGLPRYAATDPVRLDGSGSYDPDHSGPLTFAWKQVAGPPLVITDANTATPTISGFVQTDQVQECDVQLAVGDGGGDESVDTVKVIVVPEFGGNSLVLESGSFDPDKPTIVYFPGGDCINGEEGEILWLTGPAWTSRANVIDFPFGYGPDSSARPCTYHKYGDMIIAYLSAVAPAYRQPIQTSGWSTGGQPAIDVALRLNLTYRDARYAVNRVTFLDATPYCRESYQESIERFLANPVDGEQCWIDNYVSTPLGSDPRNLYPGMRDGVLNVWFDSATNASIEWYDRHCLAPYWYGLSLGSPGVTSFNHGVVGGGYWSVVGPGKNLQLASTPSAQTYSLTWYGDAYSGHIDLYDESPHPGKLPEPVTLLGPIESAEPNAAVLTCYESENAVGYELLVGSDPYRVMDYAVLSDTPMPPSRGITSLPFAESWWTVRVRDRYGSTIYADPRCLNTLELRIVNSNTRKRYGCIQDAIDQAALNEEIVLGSGTYF